MSSAVRKLVIPSPAVFDAQLASILSSNPGSSVFLLFTGEVVPETGHSWCPDCVRAEPAINAALDRIAASGADVTFVECPVVRAEYKGNPAYPYRTHPLLKITEVPTLFKWGKAKSVGKLAGSDLEDADTIVDAFSE